MRSLLRDTFLKVLTILLFFTNPFKAQNELTLDDKGLTYIGKHLEILKDQTTSLGYADVLKRNDLEKVNSDVPNLGVSSHSHWIRLSAVNVSEKKEFVIQLALATIDYVDYYAVYEDGRVDSVKTGDCRLFSNREFSRPDFTFKFALNKGEKVNLLFRLAGGEQLQAPINIGEESSMLRTFIREDAIMGIYSGIILTMILYNIFIFFSTRDKSYLFYVIYILTVGLTQLNFLGYCSKFFWPNSTLVANQAVYILSSFTAIFSIEFMKRFLFTKAKTPKLHNYFLVFYSIYYLAMLFAFIGKFNWAYQIIQINAMLAATYILIVAGQIAKQGYRPAKFFLLAWSTFLVGVSVFVFKDLGIIPYNSFTYYMMPTGSALEVILLSFALADRINILRKEKEDSQFRNLELLQENERIIKEQNVQLEIKVKERTGELEASNKSLKEAEAILVNAEKMASLGQLTAGISHEINNPINYVVSNIKPLKRDIDEILLVLKKYSEINDAKDLKEKLEEINALKQQLDINYLIEEIDLLLKGIGEGAKRTSEIVKGLKNFSRMDEADRKRVNVNEGIEATLTLLNNNLSNAKISVKKNLGNIPEIECYPGKLNQVFMNLLSNAAHALTNENIDREKIITIDTLLKENNVIIKISDNGIGIPAQNLSKIFEPFFTTKDVGEGTGLGLSIVYGIIKSHNGKIDVVSEENKNTIFTIALPITN